MDNTEVVLTLQQAEIDISKFRPLMNDISENDNLIEIGLTSLDIMRLVNKWRKAGSGITFVDVMKNPVLKEVIENVNTIKAVKKRQKKLIKNKKNIYLPFDMTDVQYSYWVGRQDNQVMGGNGCHAYLELDCEYLDVEKLNNAWKYVLKHHPMLHTKFTAQGQQQLMDNFEPEGIVIKDFSSLNESEQKTELEETRAAISHRKFEIEKGETSAVTVCILNNAQYRLIFDVDLLVADVQSFQKILDDLALVYSGENLTEYSAKWNFSDYLTEEKKRHSDPQDEEYWNNKIENLPGYPELPLKVNPETVYTPEFTTRSYVMDGEKWSGLKEIGRQYKTTPAMILLTVYCLIIERWSAKSQFTVNLPVFNRNTENEEIERVISDFSNIMVMGIDLTEKKTFAEYLEDIKENFFEASSHNNYSGVKVVRALSKKYNSATPAPVVFACNLGEELLSDNVKTQFGNLNYMISQTPQVWIDFQMFNYENNSLLLKWDAVEEIFPDGLLDIMFQSCVEYLIMLAENIENWEKTPYISLAEQDAYDCSYNHTENKLFESKLLTDEFIENAVAHPEWTAIKNFDGTTSYGALKTYAERLAAALIKNGINGNENIAVTLPKGKDQIISVLGVQLSGGCYVPIGNYQPLARQESIYKQADIKMVVTDKATYHSISFPENVKAVFIDEVIYDDTLIYSPGQINAEDNAYIIFTSGSTGEPKGVVIQHKSAYNTIHDINERNNVTNTDSIIAISALDFDLSVYDIFGMLSAGGSIVTITDENKRNAENWIQLLNQYKVTMWNTVPALIDMVLTCAEDSAISLPYLEKVFLSGDWISLNIPERLYNTAPDSRLVSMGGATEASIWSNYYNVTLPLMQDWKSIPYGYALTNQQFRIVDDKERNCPKWVIGELLIGGNGLARCYCNNKAQTESHFFTDHDGDRWYRTGDLGRFRENGIIEFLGRKDFQVKVRGHRIELNEIKKSLSDVDNIKDYTVLAVKDKTDVNHLVLYLVMKDKNFDKVENKKSLKNIMKKKLPSYMIPEIIVYLDNIPITANGKVDVKKLKSISIEEDLKEKTKGLTVETETEKSLAVLWSEILGKKTIFKNDNYFENGGDSLSAVKLAGMINKKFSIKFSLADIFNFTTLEQQSLKIDELKHAQSKNYDDIIQIVRDEEHRYEEYSLTNVQSAYWMGNNNWYNFGNISTHYYFELKYSTIDVNLMEKAVNQLIQSQDMLHTVFSVNGDGQRTLKKFDEYKIIEYDFSNLEDPDEEIEKIRAEMAHKTFDNTVLYPFDLRVVKLKEYCRLNICFNNIIFDGRSVYLFFGYLNEAYLNPDYKPYVPAITFRDYIKGLEQIRETNAYKESKNYWHDRIGNLPLSPQLPVKHLTINDSKHFVHAERTISKEIWSRIKDKIAEAGGITPSVFLISLYAEVLSLWSKTSDFTLNLTHFNRVNVHEDIEKIIGDFTSLILFETDVTSRKNFTERCRKNQQQLWNDMDHSSYDGVEVQKDYVKEHNINGIAFPYVFTSALGLNGRDESVEINRLYSCSETPQVWLDHQVSEEEGNLVLVWDYVKEQFDDGMIDDIITAYIDTFYLLSENDEIWERNSENITYYNYPESVIEANNTNMYYPDFTLQELYNNAVSSCPDNVFITDGGDSYTYKEFDRKINPIAMSISQKNHSSPVAVLIEKSISQIEAVLAVIKSGFTYVPLDVKYPVDRVEEILDESQIDYIVTDRNSYQKYSLSKIRSNFIILEDCKNNFDCEFKKADLDDLAYIIYTSGSTGKPKGVAIQNKAVVNTLLDINKKFNVTSSDKTITVSNLNFDLSVYDIFGMIACGGGIVIVKEIHNKNPYNWLELIENENVTIWNTVPAFAQMLAECALSEYHLKTMMLSGDWIPLSLPGEVKKYFTDVNIISLGGATEASIWSNYYEVNEIQDSWRSIPYGKPLANQNFIILNDRMEMCPVNVPGSLYISGKGLAEGYYNNKVKTEESFIFYKGEKIYSTGDNGKWHYDGNIEFLGRDDLQVKINGFRIELEEINEVIKKCDNVKSCFSVVSKNNNIISFIVPLTEKELINDNDIQKIKTAAESKLTEYMCPSEYIVLDQIPYTQNGKVDRKKLKEYADSIEQSQKNVIIYPETENERIIYDVICDVLENKNLSMDDSFITAGGDSLSAIKTINTLKNKEITNITIQDIFNSENLKALAAVIDNYESSSDEDFEFGEI